MVLIIFAGIIIHIAAIPVLIEIADHIPRTIEPAYKREKPTNLFDFSCSSIH